MKDPDWISSDFGQRISNALSEESDRACVILISSWADHLLRKKIAREFSKGNADARAALLSPNGPFATFSAKINAAFCAGWIDRDVYHDLHVIRALRNDFAHSIEAHSLVGDPHSSKVDQLRVPKREYYDWDEFRAAATEDGVIIFTSDRPPEALEDLSLGKLRFRMAASILMAVLIANLGLPVDVGDPLGPVSVDLPEHMREIAD